MTIYTPVNKNTTTFTATNKAFNGAGQVFFGWLFLFTQPGSQAVTYNTINKNTTSYTPINKN